MDNPYWSPGGQFYFLDGYAYSVDKYLRTFRVPEKEIILDGSKKHGNQTIDNLITIDITQRR